MVSLYVHIPFCKHKCLYCGFFSTTLKQYRQHYVDCLITELKDRKDLFDKNLYSIYFGGGTPSVLGIEDIEKLIAAIDEIYGINGKQEFTFEANPEDLTEEYLKNLKRLGINRLSIGIQSFSDKELKFLNRTHTSLQSIKAVENAKKTGFNNISVDLINSLPYSEFSLWQDNLSVFLSLNIDHLSCYTLMIEEGTMLDKLIRKNKIKLISEKESLSQLEYAVNLLEENGYNHYETSSFARNGKQSAHNTVYWKRQPYLGIGAGAHSFCGNKRFWNENDIEKYLQRIKNKDFNPPYLSEQLSKKDEYNEYIMLSLRMKEGMNADYVRQNFPQYYNNFSLRTTELRRQRLLSESLSLTKQGFYIQDSVILELCE